MRPPGLLLVLFALLPPIVLAQPADDSLAEGRAMSSAFLARKLDPVWRQMTPELQGALKSPQGLAAFREQVSAQLGDEVEVVEENAHREGEQRVYLRTARYKLYSGPILMQWAFDSSGKVSGFFVRPAQAGARTPAPSAYLDRATLTPLHLPFADEFTVFWGGRSVEQNYHAVDRNQRFAYDLLVMRDGSSHLGDGKDNRDYFCFGRPVLAPAAGRVVEVVGDVEDNLPGHTNPVQVTGNRVVIDHGHGEYSLLAHLRRGSIKVHAGDEVGAGQPLGECGNTGNSSEPHLHYQLQDGPRFADSAGLPAQFLDYLADDKPIVRGEPVRGQRIRPNSHSSN